MKLNELKPQPGSKHRRKRVGRGPGSGQGKTSGRGHKGANARSGGKVHSGFEGGQMPLVRRVPKRGFHPLKKREYILVNIEHLNRFKMGEKIAPEGLKEMGLIKRSKDLVKILGKGELAKKGLEVAAHAFSRGAIHKIKAAGGKVEIINKLGNLSLYTKGHE
ncbi:50S ribosomal protein L15 [candidate division NPL-UPA2 bacterium]|nr:50S ribosomal protein L15 [candidate division NPL-UPA2 bacterium]